MHPLASTYPTRPNSLLGRVSFSLYIRFSTPYYAFPLVIQWDKLDASSFLKNKYLSEHPPLQLADVLIQLLVANLMDLLNRQTYFKRRHIKRRISSSHYRLPVIR